MQTGLLSPGTAARHQHPAGPGRTPPHPAGRPARRGTSARWCNRWRCSWPRAKGRAGSSRWSRSTNPPCSPTRSRPCRRACARPKDGILFIPNLERFFGGMLDAAFPKAERPLQKAFLDTDPVLIGTITQTDYDKRVAKIPAVAEHCASAGRAGTRASRKPPPSWPCIAPIWKPNTACKSTPAA